LLDTCRISSVRLARLGLRPGRLFLTVDTCPSALPWPVRTLGTFAHGPRGGGAAAPAGSPVLGPTFP
jgi:hypothetical protein